MHTQKTPPPPVTPAERREAIAMNRDVYLGFAGLAMHAELNTAGQNEEAAVALSSAADAEGQSLNERIAENALGLADAMIDAMLRRGVIARRGGEARS